MPGDIRRKFTPGRRRGRHEPVEQVQRARPTTPTSTCSSASTSRARSICERPDGTRETIATHFEGKELNSPNDVVVRSDGADLLLRPVVRPHAGLRGASASGSSASRACTAPAGRRARARRRARPYEQPNGICFSPDESLFYVNDTPGAYIDVYDAADGSLANRRRFFSGIGTGVIEEGIPDGMKCDERGNIWVTGPGGIWVISSDGEHLGVIEVPENTGNLTWGGEDWRTLYIPSSTSLYAITHARRPAPRAVHGLGGVSMADYTLDPARCALLVQDLQNDVIIDGGAFAESGSPQHAKDQNVVEHVKDLAAFCRGKGIPVIHVWYIVERGRAGPEGERAALRRRRRRSARARNVGRRTGRRLEAQDGDYVVEKMRMSAWQGTRLETLLAGLGKDTIIVTGAWTNMSIEHTSRTGADKGFYMVVPEDGCSTMNADWHNASINFALQNVSTVTTCADVKAALGG